MTTPSHSVTNAESYRGTTIADALDHLFEEHFCYAPDRLRDRFYSATSPQVAGDALVHLARVRFETHRFDFDREGKWAIVVPVFEGGQIVDFGAFAIDDEKLRRPFSLASAVGFESALWDAHYHPSRRLLLHHDAWSFLRSECVGCLPISWRKTAVDLIRNDVVQIIYADDIQARKASQLLAASLRPPRAFVQKVKVAA